MPLDRKVFDGIKVVDFGWAIAGPLTLKYLADYGATVVCVESLRRPDLLRTSTPFRDGVTNVNRAGYFAYFAANKYSISLDLNNPIGNKIARKLALWADVVADSHRPGVLEKWKLDYVDLCEAKPDLIMIRSSNQGLTGPSAMQPGLGNHINGLGGIVNLVGLPEQEPICLTVAYTDYFVPHFAVSALIAALDYRRKTNKGQLIDISQFETGLQLIAPLLLDYSVNQVEAKAKGNSCDYAAPHGAFRCKGEDRWCVISIFTESEWQAFCKLMGDPEWAKSLEFSTLSERKEHEEQLNHLIEQWTSQYEAEEVMAMLQRESVPAGVVQDARDLYNDAQLRERECFWVDEHKELGRFSYLGQPSKLSKTPAKLYRGAPSLGEHTEYVCRQLLGMTETEFEHCLLEEAFA